MQPLRHHSDFQSEIGKALKGVRSQARGRRASALRVSDPEATSECVDQVLVRVLGILGVVGPLAGPLGPSIVLEGPNRVLAPGMDEEPGPPVGGPEERLDQGEAIGH